MLGVIILVIVILCVLIAAVSSKSGSDSGGPPGDPPSRPYTREIPCPTCGSPAVAHGKAWECGWCGDCGRLR